MLQPFEFPDGFRAAAESVAFDFGRGRLPQNDAQRRIATALAQCCNAFWPISSWWSRPPRAARRGSGSRAQDKVEQVVLRSSA